MNESEEVIKFDDKETKIQLCGTNQTVSFWEEYIIKAHEDAMKIQIVISKYKLGSPAADIVSSLIEELERLKSLENK